MSLFALDTMSQARSWEELSAGFPWHVPVHFNLGWDCCGRHASGSERLALYFEDEAGGTSTLSFGEIQQAANRLSNALRALGVQRGDRVAIVLPQRPETAITHIATYQMGAIALPLSHLFGSHALEYRLRDAGACSAVVDADTLPRIWPLLSRLPELKHVIGVGGARANGVPDGHRGEAVKAYVVLTPSSAPSEALKQQIQAHVRTRLAPYQYPREIEFDDALPMTTTGKVQRWALREVSPALARPGF